MECLFCKINQGTIPSKTIYEDELVKVFLDIQPDTNGHCLIVPKEHIVTIDEVSSELMIHLLKVIKEIHILLQKKLNIEGLTICQNNNLGQVVKHLHIHLIPRYQNDNCKMCFNQDSLQEINQIFEKIME